MKNTLDFLKMEIKSWHSFSATGLIITPFCFIAAFLTTPTHNSFLIKLFYAPIALLSFGSSNMFLVSSMFYFVLYGWVLDFAKRKGVFIKTAFILLSIHYICFLIVVFLLSGNNELGLMEEIYYLKQIPVHFLYASLFIFWQSYILISLTYMVIRKKEAISKINLQNLEIEKVSEPPEKPFRLLKRFLFLYLITHCCCSFIFEKIADYLYVLQALHSIRTFLRLVCLALNPLLKLFEIVLIFAKLFFGHVSLFDRIYYILTPVLVIICGLIWGFFWIEFCKKYYTPKSGQIKTIKKI